MTAFNACWGSAVSRASSSEGEAPDLQFPGTYSTWTPRRSATCRQRGEKCPVSKSNTRSPGESVLTIAASQAPVPEAGKISTGLVVRKTLRSEEHTSELQSLRHLVCRLL